MGGFVPACHTQTFVKVAKLESYMSLFPWKNDKRQTQWRGTNTFFGTQVWYANILPNIDEAQVIDDAKTIVDASYPQQRSTFFGGHYYCFLTREYLLNLLLFYYEEHKCFPEGKICIVDKWLWSIEFFKTPDRWVSSRIWRFLPRQESFSGGQWVNIPTLSQAKIILNLTSKKNYVETT